MKEYGIIYNLLPPRNPQQHDMTEEFIYIYTSRPC